MYAASPTKPIEKTNLSPTSYKVNESFTAMKPAPRFYISKYKYRNFINESVDRKKWVPGPGAHDHEKGSNMTKGLSKGWK